LADSLENKLVIAVTSRVLFELGDAHSIFEKSGLKEYKAHQRKNEDKPLEAGTGLPLIRALLNINVQAGEDLVEVILLTRNVADSGLRIINSINESNLDISRMAFTGGARHATYLEAIPCDLFLSANPADVRDALRAGFAAAHVYPPPDTLELDDQQVRIAFDGDNVLFDGASEEIYQREGLDAFQKNEAALEDTPFNPGPFKSKDFLRL
jgi:5'-nucleotidase